MPLQPTGPGPLSGRRVLVVEDEYFLADDIVRALQALGARVVGPFGELKEATAIVDGDGAIDAAIVDINLRTEMVFPLARILQARRIPFVFTTGYDAGSIEAEFQDVRLLGKPLDMAAMARELTGLINGQQARNVGRSVIPVRAGDAFDTERRVLANDYGPDATDALIASQTHELIREAVRLLKNSDGLV